MQRQGGLCQVWHSRTISSQEKCCDLTKQPYQVMLWKHQQIEPSQLSSRAYRRPPLLPQQVHQLPAKEETWNLNIWHPFKYSTEIRNASLIPGQIWMYVSGMSMHGNNGYTVSSSFILENIRLVPHNVLVKDADQEDSHRDQIYFQHKKVQVPCKR